jgi:hypothetical protein
VPSQERLYGFDSPSPAVIISIHLPIILAVIMRLNLLSSLAFLVLGVAANPVKEESSTTVTLAENISCEGSHFIVSVQRCVILTSHSLIFCRTDDVKEDSGELIAEKISNIVSVPLKSMVMA